MEKDRSGHPHDRHAAVPGPDRSHDRRSDAHRYAAIRGALLAREWKRLIGAHSEGDPQRSRRKGGGGGVPVADADVRLASGTSDAAVTLEGGITARACSQ